MASSFVSTGEGLTAVPLAESSSAQQGLLAQPHAA
jgi:hypothetical protein